ncbi:hypothetical protein AB4Y32_07410 [Paraburkholderia phymatum]|uniref:Uncharacterized protein n=1 Tax=Paraburkholderia phymatum TaxID=148447 RepID=A0ACC6TW70_9BURK
MSALPCIVRAKHFPLQGTGRGYDLPLCQPFGVQRNSKRLFQREPARVVPMQGQAPQWRTSITIRACGENLAAPCLMPRDQISLPRGFGCRALDLNACVVQEAALALDA